MANLIHRVITFADLIKLKLSQRSMNHDLRPAWRCHNSHQSSGIYDSGIWLLTYEWSINWTVVFRMGEHWDTYTIQVLEWDISVTGTVNWVTDWVKTVTPDRQTHSRTPHTQTYTGSAHTKTHTHTHAHTNTTTLKHLTHRHTGSAHTHTHTHTHTGSAHTQTHWVSSHTHTHTHTH